ncbi:MAG: type II toxin-antitoxin system CcdA family antitoxin [Alphaproteobacteria bacterium]|nr:type II toxin-antitoxin system CcdA family antitoxin [Alphaproteobacteria bacterium]
MSQTTRRRPTNITLPDALLAEARALNINISQTCERALAAEVATARREAWLRDNRAAMDAWNERVETEGLPLAAYRRF